MFRTSHTGGHYLGRYVLLLSEHVTRRREYLYIYYHTDEKTTEGKGNKCETLGSPLLQQNDELGSFIVARELDSGGTRLRLFDAS
jgi:hypothetical protein